jgi:RES domain-containing protein
MASQPRRPDRVFRISDSRHPIFDGTGAFLKGSRWNSPGRRVIYAAETLAGAMLEMLVHTRIGKIPRTHRWIEITIPDAISWEHVMPDELPGWNTDSPVTREFGDRWHREQRSLVLLVPSVVLFGYGFNVLINQDHPEFPMVQSSEPREVVWDSRLFLS